MGDMDELIEDFTRSLRSAQISDGTIGLYRRHLRYLRDWLVQTGRPTDVGSVSRPDLETYFGELGHRRTRRNGIEGETVRPTYVAAQYRSIQQFWKWLAVEEIVEPNPFGKMTPPAAPPPMIPVIPDDAVSRLLATCKGRSFVELRDTAILRMLLDNGVRVSGLAGMHLDDFDFDTDTVRITLKGGRELVIPFGAKASDATRRYKRVRSTHPQAKAHTAMWLSDKGALSTSGIRQMLERRTAQAELPVSLATNPHAWRHLFAHNWLADGQSEQDLARLMGWTSTKMAGRYGAAAAETRARAAHRRAAPGDKY
jgi:site-specific recombinase XerD